MASFLLIFVLIGRYFPRRISGVVIMLGSSAIVCAIKIFFQSIQRLLIEYSIYVFAYALTSGFVSFALAYRLGPISNHKTLNLLQWLLQIIGLALIGMSSEIMEYSCSAILAVIFIKTFPFKELHILKRNKFEFKFLTESEFEHQSDVQTKKGLEELKDYCMSSECNAWDVICKLQDPIRFARFVNGENHLMDEEIVMYENSEHKHALELIANDINDETDESNETERSDEDINNMVIASDI